MVSTRSFCKPDKLAEPTEAELAKKERYARMVETRARNKVSKGAPAANTPKDIGGM